MEKLLNQGSMTALKITPQTRSNCDTTPIFVLECVGDLKVVFDEEASVNLLGNVIHILKEYKLCQHHLKRST